MTKSILDFVVPDETWTYPVFEPFTVYLNPDDRPIHTFIDKNNQVTRVIFERVGVSNTMRVFIFAPDDFDLPDECVIWLRREGWENAANPSYLVEITNVPDEYEWPPPSTPGRVVIEEMGFNEG